MQNRVLPRYDFCVIMTHIWNRWIKYRMNVKNIYESFGEIVAGYEKQGLVPALYVERVSCSQLLLIKKVHSAGGIEPRNLFFVSCETIITDSGTKLDSYVLFAPTEMQAIDAFRRRVAFDRFLARITASGSVPKLYGIDAKGFVRDSQYVPMFNVLCDRQEDLDEIIEYANSKISCYARGFVMGRFVANGEANISYILRENLASLKDIKHVRARMLNAVCNRVAKNFDVIRLDDRGGENEENICEYLYETSRGSFLENSGAVVVKNYAQNDKNCKFAEEKVKVYEQQARY